MCYSAKASFTSAATLTVVGLLTLRKKPSKEMFMIAIIPLLFAFQQVAEGFVWVFENGNVDHEIYSKIAQYNFLIFAWIIWPVYVPLAVMAGEKIKWKWWLCAICFLGNYAIAILDIYWFFTHEVTVDIVNNHLKYDTTELYKRIEYISFATIPTFITSIPRLWVFGLALIVSFVGAEVYYSATFSSIWCFWAALMSVIIYWVVPDRRNAVA